VIAYAQCTGQRIIAGTAKRSSFTGARAGNKKNKSECDFEF
jgi:hypothetical protein